MRWTLDYLSDALAPGLIGARPRGCTLLGGVSTDSRTLTPGDVFVALVGERFDGHAFVGAAVEGGASAVVVSDPARAASCGRPVVVVTDTTVALGQLARWWRRTWNGQLIAVTGSNGKTSTKAMLASVLGATFRVHATRGNLNNQVGVPLTLLSTPPDADVAVVEIGTNHPGEVALLRDIVQPDCAVITSIGEEHLEGLGSLEGVLREETSVCVGVALAVTPAGQPEVGNAARSLGARVVEAGLTTGEARPDAFGLDAEARGWLQLGSLRARLPLTGEHNLRNAMLAVATGRAWGLEDAVIVRGLEATPPPSMRSAVERYGAMTVLNDSYNANPGSARAALATFDAIAHDGQRVIVLGSMLELGDHGPALHDEIASRALASRADVIGAVGEFAAAFARVAPGDARVVAAEDADALWPVLAPRLGNDALVLLKGSRGTRLERLLPNLCARAGMQVPRTPAH